MCDDLAWNSFSLVSHFVYSLCAFSRSALFPTPPIDIWEDKTWAAVSIFVRSHPEPNGSSNWKHYLIFVRSVLGPVDQLVSWSEYVDQVGINATCHRKPPMLHIDTYHFVWIQTVPLLINQYICFDLFLPLFESENFTWWCQSWHPHTRDPWSLVTQGTVITAKNVKQIRAS